MYTVDASVRSVKISHVHKIVLKSPWAECTARKVPMKYEHIYLLIYVCPKTNKVYIYGYENI